MPLQQTEKRSVEASNNSQNWIQQASRKFRVLHTITGLNIGGAEFMLARLLPSLSELLGSQAVLSLMAPGPVASHIDRNVAIKSLGIPQGTLPLHKIPALMSAVKSANPSIIHGWMYHGNIAAIVGKFLVAHTKPVIWSVHHSMYDIATEKPLTRTLIKLSAALSHHVHAITYCSRIAAEQHSKMGFDTSKSIVIHNGIDCSVYRPDKAVKEQLRASLGIPASRVLIGSVGRYHPMKNQADLARACALLVGQGVDIHCLFIGPGHESGNLAQFASELGVSDRVTVLGPELDMASITPGLDIHAISSAWGEAYSLATAEAMSCEVPVVVTDVGDCSYLVGNCGITVPRQNPEALAAGLRQFCALDAEQRQVVGAKSRQRILEHFSLSEYVSKHLSLYEDVSSH